MDVHTEVYTKLYAPGNWDNALLPNLREEVLALPGVRRIKQEQVGGTDEVGTRVSFVVDEDGPDPDGDDAPIGPVFFLSSPVELVED